MENDFGIAFKKFLIEIGLEAQAKYSDSIIACDGDKCYGYLDKWERHGIPKQHGKMLYLISKIHPYSQEAREKIPVDDWVIYRYKDFNQIFDKIAL